MLGSSDDDKKEISQTAFHVLEIYAYFMELVLEHRLKKVENQYDFLT